MTKKSPASSSPKVKALTVQRIFDATPKKLWSYWTDPEKFAKWFNPAPGLDLVIHEYDARPGGRVRFDMPQPDGNKNPQEGIFHVLKPYREITSGAPDKSFLIAVRLAPAGKKTRMTVTVTGVPRAYHEGARKGWNAGFDKLEGLLGGPAAAAMRGGLRIERTFKAPVERLWALWTTKKGIESWWGPEGFSTKVRTLELRPGGEFEYAMTASAPDQVAAMKSMGMPLTSVAHNVFTEVAPPRRLALKTRIDFVPGVPPYDLSTEVEFQAVRGGTKVVFTSSKMHSEEWEEMARQGQMSQFDKLAKIVGA